MTGRSGWTPWWSPASTPSDIDLEALLTPDVRKHVVDAVAGALRHRHLRLPAAGQPDRSVRDRRPDGRRRVDRPQDHRRHVRRHGPARWRRVLRQGPVEGGPLGGVRDALGRQERGRRRSGRGAARSRSRTRSARRTRSASTSRRFGTETVPVTQIQAGRAGGLRPAAGRDHPRPRSEAADLRQTAAYGHFGRELPEFTWERTTAPRRWRPPSAADRLFLSARAVRSPTCRLAPDARLKTLIFSPPSDEASGREPSRPAGPGRSPARAGQRPARRRPHRN